MSKREEKVYVILLNWNGADDTIACLKSLTRSTYDNVQIIVLDNASRDDSVELILGYLHEQSHTLAEDNAVFPCTKLFDDHQTIAVSNALSLPSNTVGRFPYPAVVVRNAVNYGFARAHNIVMAIIQQIKEYGYVWVLNNDTIIFPDTLAALIREAKRNPINGLVGSIIRYHDCPELVQTIGGGKFYPYCGTSRLFGKNLRVTEIPSYIRDNDMGEIDYIMGASLLIKRGVLETVGVFCEDYFVYTEDLDYCFRARREGWRLSVALDSHLLHKDSSSTKDRKEIYYYLLLRNNTLFVKKYFPLRCLISTVVVFPINLIRWTKNPKNIIHGLKGLVQGILSTAKTI